MSSRALRAAAALLAVLVVASCGVSASDDPPAGAESYLATLQDTPKYINLSTLTRNDLLFNGFWAEPLGKWDSIDVPSTTVSGGALDFCGPSCLKYVPKEGFVGTDTFRYKICRNVEPVNPCSSATVTITVTKKPTKPTTTTTRFVGFDEETTTTTPSPTTSSSTTSSSTTSTTAPVGGTAVTIQALLDHWVPPVIPGAQTYGANQVDFEITNSDAHVHTFTIDVDGNGSIGTGDIDESVGSSGITTFTVTLPPGTYTFKCTDSGHGAMQGTITVS